MDDSESDSGHVFKDAGIQTDSLKTDKNIIQKTGEQKKQKNVKRYTGTFKTFGQSLIAVGIDEFEVPNHIYEIDNEKNEAKVSYFNSIEPTIIRITELKNLNPSLLAKFLIENY